jgi:hypothetical protein
MAELPCAFCDQRFLGAALTCYWAWYENDERLSFVQKSMPECAKDKLDPWLSHAIDRATGTVVWPTVCPVCNEKIEGDAMPLYVTLYHGKHRKDLVVPHCSACMSRAFEVVTLNAQRLPERSVIGGRGGAPSPTTMADLGREDDLPW